MKGGGGGGSRRGYRIFHKHPPPPWTLSADVIHIPRGAGVITPVTHTHTHPESATGVHLRSTSKKGGGGSNFGPNVKKPTSWPKGGGGSGPPPPLDPPLLLFDSILHTPAPRLLPARTLLDHINNLLRFPWSRSLPPLSN